ncbi:MAG: DUF2807 domain-containing protein [Myxococcota bacterium]
MNRALTLLLLGSLTTACDDDLDKVHINISDGNINVTNRDEPPAPEPAGAPVDVTGFDALGTETFVDVVANVGPKHAARLQCDPEIAKTLEVLVDDTVLVVRKASTTSTQSASGPCTLHATAPNWRAVVSIGSGDVQISGPLPALEQVHSAGSGDVSITGVDDAPSLLVAATGAGDIALQGSAGTLTASTSGSGDVLAGNLAAQTATATTTGSGDVAVHTNETLTALTRGSGDILTSGPGSVTATSEGSGQVRQ